MVLGRVDFILFQIQICIVGYTDESALVFLVLAVEGVFPGLYNAQLDEVLCVGLLYYFLEGGVHEGVHEFGGS